MRKIKNKLTQIIVEEKKYLKKDREIKIKFFYFDSFFSSILLSFFNSTFTKL